MFPARALEYEEWAEASGAISEEISQQKSENEKRKQQFDEEYSSIYNQWSEQKSRIESHSNYNPEEYEKIKAQVEKDSKDVHEHKERLENSISSGTELYDGNALSAFEKTKKEMLEQYQRKADEAHKKFSEKADENKEKQEKIENKRNIIGNIVGIFIGTFISGIVCVWLILLRKMNSGFVSIEKLLPQSKGKTRSLISNQVKTKCPYCSENIILNNTYCNACGKKQIIKGEI